MGIEDGGEATVGVGRLSVPGDVGYMSDKNYHNRKRKPRLSVYVYVIHPHPL